MTKLNTWYFTLDDEIYDKDTVYQTYITSTRTPALVLYCNNTNQPIAAVQITGPLNDDKTLFAARNEPNAFQGIVGKSGSKIRFIITNLTGFGRININLLRKDVNVTQINPGPQDSINKITELRPYTSYEIPCDQLNDREIIITGIKKQDGTSLRVDEDEKLAKETNTKKQAMEIFVSVLPQTNCPELEKLFENTTWRVSPGVILQQKKPIYKRIDALRTVTSSNVGYERMDSMDGLRNLNHRVVLESISTNYALDLEKKPKGALEVAIPECSQTDIFASNAAKFEYGDKVHESSSHETGQEYVYSKPSAKCHISFSVMECTVFKDFKTNAFYQLLVEHMKAEVKLLIEGNWKSILEKSKKFVSETCCYCMDAVPNIILYSCGHQCACKECITQDKSGKCPMCRSIVCGHYKC